MDLPRRSAFQLQIIHRETGTVVRGFEPGSQVETDLVEELITRVKGYGIGMFKSEATVEAAIRRAWTEQLLSLKSQVRPGQV